MRWRFEKTSWKYVTYKEYKKKSSQVLIYMGIRNRKTAKMNVGREITEPWKKKEKKKKKYGVSRRNKI